MIQTLKRDQQSTRPRATQGDFIAHCILDALSCRRQRVQLIGHNGD
jgi:hypothetical protein